MKKILILMMMAMTTITMTAQTIGEAFYIYRNDGYFNAFFREEVDSIVYSNYDNDSIWYNDVVTQVVYTPDSIYRIPLAAIDSVGFVTPKTIYQQGVRELDDYFKSFIISVDSLTISVSNSISPLLIPQKGEKIATTVMDDLFPVGFVGKVCNIEEKDSNIDIVCDAVAIEDIFVVYYGCSQMEWDGNKVRKRHLEIPPKESNGNTYNPGKLTIPLVNTFGFSNSYKKNDNLSFDLNELDANISVTPVVIGNGIRIVDPAVGVYISLTMTGTYDLEENFSLKGGFTWQKDNSFLPERLFWPILPLADVYLDVGWFVRASGELGIQQTWTQKYRSAFHWEYNSRGEELMKPINKIIPISADNSGMVAINGEMGVGIFVDFGVDFIHTKKLDIANLHLRGEVGASLSSNLVLYNDDFKDASESTSAYEKLRDTEVDFNWFYGVLFEGNFFKWDFSMPLPDFGNLKLNNRGKILSFNLAPSFSEIKVQKNSNIIDTECKVSAGESLLGLCLPTNAGFWVKDKQQKEIDKTIVIDNYHGGFQQEMKKQFSNIPSGKKIIVYPYISWMGKDLLATPYVEVDAETEVTTLSATEIEKNSALLRGQLKEFDRETDNGDVGFYYNTTGQPKAGNSKYVSCGSAKNLSDDGNFQYRIYSLEPNTTYYFCAAYQGDDIIYGETKTFKTKQEITVQTNSATNITKNSATLNGQMIDFQPEAASGVVGFVYNTSGNPNTDNASNVIAENLTSSSTGYFQAQISNLSEDTKYYFRAYCYNNGEYYYGETKSFKTTDEESILSCPDDNHPHMIDLGLPSGTKWACCNVDPDYTKQQPTNYGGYYAWGETEVKSVYNSYTYEHRTRYPDLGSDISGSQYDVAQVKWGGSWVMPSLEQVKELINTCSYSRVQINGVYGGLFTGPNGNSIFLPPVGEYTEYGIEGFGNGFYWTSTQDPTNEVFGAYYLEFTSKRANWFSFVRYRGKNVRPVSK